MCAGKSSGKQVLAASAMEWGLTVESDGGFYQCWWVREVLVALQAAYLCQCIHACAMALASLLEKGKTQECVSCLLLPFPRPGTRAVEYPGLIWTYRGWWGMQLLLRESAAVKEDDSGEWEVETKEEAGVCAGSKCKPGDQFFFLVSYKCCLVTQRKRLNCPGTKGWVSYLRQNRKARISPLLWE